MTRPIVCLVSPRRLAQAQTFVRDHAARLPADVRLLSGCRPPEAAGRLPRRRERWLRRDNFPTRDADGRLLVAPWRRHLDRALAKVSLRRTQPLSDAVLARHLREQRVDVVLAEFGPMGVHVMRACAAAGVPLVVHFHGFDAFRRRCLARHRRSYRELFSIARALVVVSREMREQLLRLGAPQEKLLLNPCGVDTSRFHGTDPATAPARFLAVGRFVEKKAPDKTLHAFRELRETHPEARLVMVGDGPLLPRCRRLAARLGLERAVSFPGVLSPVKVAEAMRRARGFVQHSVESRCGDREGTPVAVLEASASCLPVVSTRHGGIPDAVIHGTTGWLVNEGDVTGMARCMRALVQAPERARALGARGRAHVRAHYEVDARITTLAGILADAIGHGPARVEPREPSRTAA